MNDLISRDALMEEYMEYLNSIPIVNNGLCNMGRRDATITCIEKLRDAKSKCGEWLESENETVSGVCSCCGWMSHFYEDDVAGMPFCPNCGARMKQTDSFIVKSVEIDVEPPKTCYECAFNAGEYTPNEYEKRYCGLKGKSFCLKDYKKRPNWCPLKGPNGN